MTNEEAFSLVKQYIEGWNNNLKLIMENLTENCVVIESHGPTYHGIDAIQRWFNYWLEANSSILNWNILSFYFCEEEQTAFCEWDFKCVSNHIPYALSGISLIKFSKHKIAFIHEYRMSQKAYP